METRCDRFPVQRVLKLIEGHRASALVDVEEDLYMRMVGRIVTGEVKVVSASVLTLDGIEFNELNPLSFSFILFLYQEAYRLLDFVVTLH